MAANKKVKVGGSFKAKGGTPFKKKPPPKYKSSTRKPTGPSQPKAKSVVTELVKRATQHLSDGIPKPDQKDGLNIWMTWWSRCKTANYCVFCLAASKQGDKSKHASSNCYAGITLFPKEQLRDLQNMFRICRRCMRAGHSSSSCTVPLSKCIHCKGQHHHINCGVKKDKKQ